MNSIALFLPARRQPMMKTYRSLALMLLLPLVACSEDYLITDPQTILTDEQV